jgi:hypothetical protein
VAGFQVKESDIQNLLRFAESEGLKPTYASWRKDLPSLQLFLKANLGRQLYGNDAYYPTMHQRDSTLKKTME